MERGGGGGAWRCANMFFCFWVQSATQRPPGEQARLRATVDLRRTCVSVPECNLQLYNGRTYTPLTPRKTCLR